MNRTKQLLSAALCLALTLSVLLFSAVQRADAASEIIRIGVMKFASRAQGLEQQQAEAITDLFTRMLSNSQSIAIIERDRLESIGSEHKLNMSGLVDSNTAAELGRLAGCQYILLGSVTQFDKKSQTSGLLGIIKTTTQVANVTIDMRVVNVETGEVVLSMAETGTASDQSSGFNYYIQVEDSRLEGLEGEAVANAVSKLGLKLKESVAGEYAQIVSISGKEIMLNIGASLGARKGGLYLVYADGAEVRDMNGRSLGRKNINLAVLKVVDAQNEFCEAQIVENGGKIDVLRRGDKVMPISGGDAKKLAEQKAFVSERPRKMGIDFDALGSTAPAAGEITLPESTSSPAATSAPAAQKRDLENVSTDPGKVIASYGLPDGEANIRRIAHINIGKLKDKKQAYEKYVELAESYSGDYLAAYRAGETALALKKTDDAKTWFDKALAINPNYEPAQKAKAKLAK